MELPAMSATELYGANFRIMENGAMVAAEIVRRCNAFPAMLGAIQRIQSMMMNIDRERLPEQHKRFAAIRVLCGEALHAAKDTP